MTDFPIIFSTPMVRALLEGRKTQTRRLAWRSIRKGERSAEGDRIVILEPGRFGGKAIHLKPTSWQKRKPGDRLWVRETLTCSGAMIQYVADRHTSELVWPAHWKNDPRPSIHMPRWASRITLLVTDVRRERVQEISEEDALAEGVGEPYLADGDPPFEETATMISSRRQFRALWSRLHGQDAWEANPEVVVPTFQVHLGNIDSLNKE